MPARNAMLIVDDEDRILFALQSYFTACGYGVDAAQSLSQAYELIKATRYAVVITDLRMGADQNAGLEVVKAVHDGSPSTRVVVLTAYGNAEVERAARTYGADAFLSKPIPLGEVATTIRGLVGSDEPTARSAAASGGS
jgi:DNA-binding NtrC family response regulator